MGLLIAVAAGLLGFLFSVRPGGERLPRRWGLLGLSAAVYLAILGVIFVALVLLASSDRLLSGFVVASAATFSAVSDAFAARRKGAEWWLLLAWPVPLMVVLGAALLGSR